MPPAPVRQPSLLELLDKGFLPRELPPPFNAHSFAAFATSGVSWASTGRWTRCCSHNVAKPGGLRRPIRIPNPISYFALANTITQNWLAIRAHTWKHRLSVSRPYVLSSSSRAVIPRYYFGEVPRLRALRRRGAKYVLCTDINQFYPTIYTHTIPWAMHTKAACKVNLAKPKQNKATLLGDLIDHDLRVMNEGQTHGIPIGPDASLVAAELLLAAIDDELLRRCPGLSGFRYIDDYDLSFATLSEAEHALTEVQSVMAAYELQLNPRKTTIQPLPKPLDDSWAHELREFPVRDATEPIRQRNDIVALFSRAFELAAAHPEKPVLRYAVARLQGHTVADRAWHAFQNCLLGAVGADAATLPWALGCLYKVSAQSGNAVALTPLASALEAVIRTHAPRKQGNEVAWALWAARSWGVPLSSSAGAVIAEMDDDVVALLALDCLVSGILPSGAVDPTRWEASVAEPDALKSEHWLLAYQAYVSGLLPVPAMAAEPDFQAMAKGGVSFYDSTQNAPQFPGAATKLPGGELEDFYA